MSEQGNPGTPADNTADTPTGASESVEQEVREAAQDEKQQDRTDWKAMALGLKATLEERNRREAEQSQQMGASYTSPTDPRMANQQAEWAELRAAYAELQQEAAQGDRKAFLQLKVLEDQMATKAEMMNQQALFQIPDHEKRAKVWDHFQKNRHRLPSIDLAEAELDAVEYRAYKATLAQKEKDAQAVISAKQAGVVGTHGSREVSAEEAKVRKMTGEQFDNEIGRLRAEGKDSEALRLMGLVRNRKVILTG